jgi:hypothetical protein
VAAASEIGLASFGNLQGSSLTAHFGLYPTAMGRINLDGGVSEFMGEVNGKLLSAAL